MLWLQIPKVLAFGLNDDGLLKLESVDRDEYDLLGIYRSLSIGGSVA